MAENCDDCDGSGKCRHCEGTGTITNDPPAYDSYCNPCDGSGTCNVCRGSGEHPPTFGV